MQLELKNIKEHKDGSATYNVFVDSGFQDMVKKQYNRKRYSDKLGSIAIIDALYAMMIREEKLTKTDADNALKEAYKLNGIRK